MRLLESDTSPNVDISGATLVGTYTADAVRSVFAQIFADQLAGDGAYTAYLTIQRGGTGSAYQVLLATVPTVASGVTAVMFVTMPVIVSSGDVVKAYLDGLAGDTTTPDIICDWWEDDSLRPATADRTLAVDSNGKVDVAANADKTGYSLASAPPAASAIADAVWDEALSGHVTTGSAGAKLTTSAAAGLGTGTVSETVTVTDGTNPLDGVEVWVTTDSAGTNVAANGVTDAQGQVTFQLDVGNYYLWKRLTGWEFDNPTALAVSA